MKLVFSKRDNEDIKVEIQKGESRISFDYPEMVKLLYNDKQIEDSELIGEFSEIEKKSINELIQSIRQVIRQESEELD